VSVDLIAVRLNHDASSAADSALNLRRNGGGQSLVGTPEWRFGISETPPDSPAAYAIAATQGQALAIEVQLASSEFAGASIDIRAIDPAVSTLPDADNVARLSPLAAKAYVRAWLAYTAKAQREGLRTNVLGDVALRRIQFAGDGTTQSERFALAGVRLAQRGVGASDVNWRWQFRPDDTVAWRDFGWSAHRIYAVLDVPTAPWQQQPFGEANTQLPWSEVLEYACAWASGERTVDGAARAITAGVYSLGQRLVRYDCPGGGSTHYTWLVPRPMVDCTAFLELLDGGPGNGRLVDCIDCAAIVSSFANALGCDLWQSGMFSPDGTPFALNPILAVGTTVWQTACNWGAFGYHEVAWKGACNTDDAVFDACLLVNGAIDPTRAPHIPLLAANLEFGQPGQGYYRDRLAAPVGRPNCTPRPNATRQRRFIR
jgi:hypothetical protein